MRKTIGTVAPTASATSGEWLDLETLASVEISSEDPAYIFEEALGDRPGEGWRAAQPGPQLIRIRFDVPQHLRRLYLEFCETTAEREQQTTLTAQLASGERRELVRQQWSFSPGGSSSEVEDYRVDVSGVAVLEIAIDPGRHDRSQYATLRRLAVG